MTLFVLAVPSLALVWMCWLYFQQSRRLIQVERDNMRLIRRMGQYHNIALTTPTDKVPLPDPEIPVPAAFRAIRPTPNMSVVDLARIRRN